MRFLEGEAEIEGAHQPAGWHGPVGLMEAADSLPAKGRQLTEAKVNKLAAAIRGGLHQAPPDMRKAYIKMFVDQVVVSRGEIRISGPKGILAKAALNELPETSAEAITFV